MDKPFAEVDRDASIKGWEVATGIDNDIHMGVVVYYLDDGTTVMEFETAEGVRGLAYKRGREVPNPIVRIPSLEDD